MFSNNRGWIFLGGVSLAFLILGQSLMGRQGLLLGFFAACLLNFCIYYANEKLVIRFFRAKLILGQDCWGVNQSMEKICDDLNTPAPEVLLTQIDSPIICCTNRGWGKSKIILSEHLLEKLTKEEIYQLLLVHVMYILSLNSFFVGFRTQFAEIIFIISRFLDNVLSLPLLLAGKELPLVVFQRIFLPIGTLFLEPQKKELLKFDETAAKAIGSKEKYVRLMWKLQSLIQTKPFATPPSSSLLFAINPLTTDGTDKYFQKHFALETRIKKLIGYYPL